MFFRGDNPDTSVRSIRREAKRLSAMRRRRTVFGSMIAVALSSPLVWSAPASADPVQIPANEEPCISSSDDGPFWRLFRFSKPSETDEGETFPGYTSSYEFDGDSVFFTLTVPVGSFNSFEEVDPRVYFHSTPGCIGDPVPAPTDFRACLVTKEEGAIFSFELNFRAGRNIDPPIPASVGVSYSLANDYELLIDDLPVEPTAVDFEEYVLDKDFEGDEVTLQIEIALSPQCEFRAVNEPGPTNGPRGIFLDIDPETFLNRAPAESGDLPDTL